MIGDCQCRGCGSKQTEFLGLLPEQNHFAGKLINQILPKTSLYKCNSCLLMLRHPILPASDYNALYEKADSDVWTSDKVEPRPDMAIVKKIILNKKSTCKVLDVGCYTGDLLASLPSYCLKYGIEMSKEASKVSIEKGVNIIGNDLYDIRTEEKFDVIIAIDVIEHTENPHKFLKELSGMLELDGMIIVSTGNSDNWLWRYLKNRFWYSKFLEHISFIGEKWLEKFCGNNNFIIVDKCNFNYSSMTFSSFVKNIAKLILTIMYIKPERFSNTTKDHFCFVIKEKI